MPIIVSGSQGQKSQDGVRGDQSGIGNASADSSDGEVASSGSGGQTTDSGSQEPNQASGTSARLPSAGTIGSGKTREMATDSATSGSSGNYEPNRGALTRPSGEYSLESLPNSASDGGGSQRASGSITSAERAAILDERLRRGYETFDGFILGERERAQNESNAAGSVAIGGSGGNGSSGGAAGGQRQPQTMEEASVVTAAAVGRPSTSSGEPQETFPPPEDIPSGRDDDVVARQLREAASTEPDPELREALWEEYRNYTGIGDDQ